MITIPTLRREARLGGSHVRVMCLPATPLNQFWGESYETPGRCGSTQPSIHIILENRSDGKNPSSLGTGEKVGTPETKRVLDSRPIH